MHAMLKKTWRLSRLRMLMAFDHSGTWGRGCENLGGGGTLQTLGNSGVNNVCSS